MIALSEASPQLSDCASLRDLTPFPASIHSTDRDRTLAIFKKHRQR
jgi:hypothetical protein